MPTPPTPIESVLTSLGSLADDTRLRLLKLLESHELGVGELGQILQLPQPTVSRHLKTLSDAGFLISRREGTSNLYRMVFAELPGPHKELWAAARNQIAGWPELAQDQGRVTELLREKLTASRQFFAGAAAEWDKLRSELYGESFTTAALLSLLPPTATIADLACGTGTTSAALAPYLPGGHIIAIDNSPEMLAAARQRCDAFPNVTVKEGDLTALPIDSSTCDAALLLLALTYAPDPRAVLAEAARILKPAGRLVVVDLLPHAREDFRRKLNQLHPGFAPEQLRPWIESAGLIFGVHVPLPSPSDAKGPSLFLTSATR